ncbi:MAG: peptide chain release factor N(5)-glutamine methyltransferase [Chloroflexia bacterium]|nr:peptide chain release factor N(5)-glutamine methyltransferase [Chloroflexia bacterium]
MNVRDLLREGTIFLRERGSPSARLDAELLLAHCLGQRRVDLYTHPQREPGPQERQAYRSLLERRARQEPVSYLLGRKEFYGLSFLVDERVLIPRPETEVLVELTLERARGRRWRGLRLADVGTGSGCIAVALARHLPQARVYATDISAAALALALENCRRHGVEERVALLLGDLCEPLPEVVDLLLCNPPYTVWGSLPGGIRDYEPRLALDGGPDGLAFYRRLLQQLPGRLSPGGSALLELGDNQAESVLDLFRAGLPGVPLQTWPDVAGLPRVLEIGPL